MLFILLIVIKINYFWKAFVCCVKSESSIILNSIAGTAAILIAEEYKL